SGSGADGDSRLHGTWEMTYGSQTITITFNSNGAMEQSYGNTIYSGIWKADGGSFFMYSSSFDSSSRGSAMPYTVSGSTLTLDGLELTKK
ncbi:MAG: hypothetical protein LBK43_10905, partial [Treponema sp.]|nr:hypothetical protein [Treponema sp.]